MRNIFLILMALSVSLTARDLTIDDAVKMAFEHSRAIKMAREDLKKAKYEFREALANALPVVSASGEFSHNLKQTSYISDNFNEFGQWLGESFVKIDQEFDSVGAVTPYKHTREDSSSGGSSETFPVLKNNFHVHVEVDQTLYSAKVGIGLRTARIFDKYTTAQFDLQKQALFLRTHSVYFSAKLAEKVVEIAERSVKNARENLRTVELGYKEGRNSEYEFLQAKVRLANSEPVLISAKKQLIQQTDQLKTLIGLGLEETLDLVSPIEYKIAELEAADSSVVFKRRPDYQSLLRVAEMQQMAVSANFAGHFPVLSGFLTYDLNSITDAIALDNEDEALKVGLRLQIPIFSGGRTHALVQKARVDQKKAELQSLEMRDQVRLEMKTARLTVQESEAKVQSAEAGLEAAEKAYSIAENLFKNAAATQLELWDMQLALDQSRINHSTAKFEHHMAILEYNRVYGLLSMTEAN